MNKAKRNSKVSRGMFAVCAGLSLWGLAAVATPQVGDQAGFDVTDVLNGKATKSTLAVSITAFDQKTQSFTLHKVQTSSDSSAAPQVSDEVDSIDDLQNDTALNETVKTCTSQQGKLSTFILQNHGVQVCMLNLDESMIGMNVQVFYGDVPFGIVRSVITHLDPGVVTTTQMTSYKMAGH